LFGSLPQKLHIVRTVVPCDHRISHPIGAPQSNQLVRHSALLIFFSTPLSFHFNVLGELSCPRPFIADFDLPEDHPHRAQYPLFGRCDIFTQRTIREHLQLAHLGMP